MYAEAAREFERFSDLTGGSTLAIASLANLQGRLGDRDGALQLAARLRLIATQENVPAYQFALLYSGLGDVDQAIGWLEKAYQQREDFLLYLKVEPLFEGLRSDQRFQALQRRVGLER
jgi:tetratricopeptide (TPR) repeat protein